jgi:hypothetical protein
MVRRLISTKHSVVYYTRTVYGLLATAGYKGRKEWGDKRILFILNIYIIKRSKIRSVRTQTQKDKSYLHITSL